MEEKSVRLLRDFWVEELGCSEQDLASRGLVVCAHGSMAGYSGVYFFRAGEACVISAPAPLVDSLRALTAGLDPAAFFVPEFMASLLKERLGKMIGPAWIGTIDGRGFFRRHGSETRLLGEGDWEALKGMLAAADPTEASHSALEPGRFPTVGVFEGRELAAAASYEVLFGKVAHVGVLVHPAFRGKGMAAKVISAITEEALSENLGIQYQTLSANAASVAAAKSVGYRLFAETIAARLV